MANASRASVQRTIHRAGSLAGGSMDRVTS
jgi:hypothetical protein